MAEKPKHASDPLYDVLAKERADQRQRDEEQLIAAVEEVQKRLAEKLQGLPETIKAAHDLDPDALSTMIEVVGHENPEGAFALTVRQIYEPALDQALEAVDAEEIGREFVRALGLDERAWHPGRHLSGTVAPVVDPGASRPDRRREPPQERKA
jgi:hypothetical protein